MGRSTRNSSLAAATALDSSEDDNDDSGDYVDDDDNGPREMKKRPAKNTKTPTNTNKRTKTTNKKQPRWINSTPNMPGDKVKRLDTSEIDELRQARLPLSLRLCFFTKTKTRRKVRWSEVNKDYIKLIRTGLDTSSPYDVVVEYIVQQLNDGMHLAVTGTDGCCIYYDSKKKSVFNDNHVIYSSKSSTLSVIADDLSLSQALAIAGDTVTTIDEVTNGNDVSPVDDDDDGGGASPSTQYLRHIDLLVHVEPTTAGEEGQEKEGNDNNRRRSKRTLPTTVRVYVLPPARQDFANINITYRTTSLEPFDFFDVSYQEFCTTNRMKYLRKKMRRIYRHHREGRKISSKSAIFMRVKAGRYAITKVKSSEFLSNQLERFMKRKNPPYFVDEEDGTIDKSIITVYLALGSIPNTDDLLEENQNDTMLCQEIAEQPFCYSSEQEKEEDERADRPATKSTRKDIDWIFNKYYLDPNSPYFHMLSHEMKWCFESRYQMDSTNRTNVINQLNEGQFPSLDWMKSMAVLNQNGQRIEPGQQIWEPDLENRPPHAFTQRVQSHAFDEILKVTQELLKSIRSSNKTTATTTTDAALKPFSNTRITVNLTRTSTSSGRTYTHSLDEDDLVNCLDGESILAALKSKDKAVVKWSGVDREKKKEFFFQYKQATQTEQSFLKMTKTQIFSYSNDNGEVDILYRTVEGADEMSDYSE